MKIIVYKFASLTAAKVKEEPLHVIQIYIDTATYDKIEKDKRVTLEAQIGLIGGTMGLFAGFSILSGVEIVYYIVRLFMAKIGKNIEKTKEDIPENMIK